MKNLNQVFIKCHDNDFWDYYRGALNVVYYWYGYMHRNNEYFNPDDVTNHIQMYLDITYQLCNPHITDAKFPYKVGVLFNEEAKEAYNKESLEGNSECAYMDIESFLNSNGTEEINDYIYNV